jgi:general secretion pathway protein C
VSFSDAISRRDLRPSPRTVRRAVEVVLVLALAAQSARFASTPTAVPVLAVGAAPEPVAPAITGYALHGVRSSIFGDGGAAIIAGPDGKQASYRPGQTVGPGVKLAAIGRDAVTLSGAGGSVRLEIGAAPTAQTAGPTAPAPLPSPGLILPGGPQTTNAPAAADAGAAQVLSQLSLSPRQQGGFTVGAQGGPALQQAGLRPGDVLLSVNGQPLDPARADQLAAGLAGARDAEVQFQRNGQTLTTRIQTGAR